MQNALNWLRERAYIVPTCLLLALLMGGEAAVRLSGFRRPWDFSQGACYQWDSNLFWRLQPGYDGVVDSVRVRVCKQGFRGPTPTGWDEGALKILCFGDSVTFGYGVEDSVAFPSYVETILDKDFGPTCVINAGVPGYSSLQILRYWDDLAQKLQPDVVILSLGGISEPSGTFDGVQDDTKPIGWRARLRHAIDRSFLFAFLSRKLHGSGVYTDPEDLKTPEGIMQGLASWHKTTRRVSPDSYEKHLASLMDRVEAMGTKMILVAVPINPYDDPGPPDMDVITPELIQKYLAIEEMSQRGLKAQALTLMDEMARECPNVAYLRYETAVLASSLGQWDLARQSYREAHDGSPRRERQKEYQARGLQMAERRGVPVVQMEPLFESSWFQPQQTRTDLFVDFCHPSAKGHELIAQALFEALAPLIRIKAEASPTPQPGS